MALHLVAAGELTVAVSERPQQQLLAAPTSAELCHAACESASNTNAENLLV
jgi:hypothetical protein